MASPPKPPGKPPPFGNLRWTNPEASGFLHCNDQPCKERGNWTGWPYLIRNRTLVQAARAWYQARRARIRRENIGFFDGVVAPAPVAVTRAAPSKTPDKPKRKKMKKSTKAVKVPKASHRKKTNRKRRSVRN